ncbi:MAG: hypothetical protein FWB80_12160 [Defluviitaleaceae bacterium]|nr:hypothetical protein [Defluviitaleaceae bacterium]
MLIENFLAANGVVSELTPEKKTTAAAEQKKLPESPVINEIVLQSPLPDDSALIENTRRLWRLTDADNVQIFVVEPEQFRRMRFTNFVTRPTTSARLVKLNRNLSSGRSQLNELKMGLGDPTLTDSERGRKIAFLEEEVKQNRRAVARERTRLANAPRSGVIVVARGSDGG